MKLHSLFLTLLLLCSTACAQSATTNTRRAIALAERAILEADSARHSYESLEMELDSAFSPLDSPEWFDTMIKLHKLSTKAKELMEERGHYEKILYLYQSESPLAKQISQEAYQKAMARYQAISDSVNYINHQGNLIVEPITKQAEEEPKFIGFKVVNTYKLTDKSGKSSLHRRYFLFDKEVSKVLISYDADSKEFKEIKELLLDIRYTRPKRNSMTP